MKISNPANFIKTSVLVSTLAVFGLAIGTQVARADESAYDWSAQIVSFDDASDTLTVKARVENHANIDNLDSFSEGERLTLVWTGRQWAAGIRGLARDPDLAEGTLTLPVEFVGSEMDGRYISFRVPVPSESIAEIRSLEPGARVTGMSPRTGADWESGVISLRPYNDIS